MEKGAGACFKCGESISSGQNAVLALGHRYHERCFTCSVCRESFANASFVLHEGKPVHDKCLPAEPADVPRECGGCGEKVKGEALVAAGKAWHAACFKCSACRQVIDGAFDSIDGRVLHLACVPQGSLPDCKACRKPCANRSVVVEGAFYHPDCFQCHKCRKPLSSSYMQQDGHYFHHECVGSTGQCKECRKDLDGTIVEVDGASFHKSCFRCSVCRGEFDNSYAVADGKYVHEKCAP